VGERRVTARLRDLDVELQPDPRRTIARLFLPGEGIIPTRSRAEDIIKRIVDMPADEILTAAAEILAAFGDRHVEFRAILMHHAETVVFRSDKPPLLDDSMSIVIGAAFTAEHSVEAAALCNPSAVRHPDQTGLAAGELRLAVALRSIGEGHVSSIGFASAVIGPGTTWRFEDRVMPPVAPLIGEGNWSRARLREALEAEGRLNELSGAVVRALPKSFRSSEIEVAIGAVPSELGRWREPHVDLDTIRTMAWSAYEATFDEGTDLSQRVLLPVTPGESNGIEDARFVEYTDEDGTVEYRASYTAYDGRSIAPRLICSPDLLSFTMHRLMGKAAVNKGMAFFPRAIGGLDWALTRTDGENISIASSKNGVSWSNVGILHRPTELWEAVQLGNCGSPIETDRGWLVLTHGVGPMRRYAIAAILLDLEDPTRVIGWLDEPLLEPVGELREGYVPNVVYSCGGIVHDGTLWLPYGVGDQRVRAAAIRVDELLDAMTALPIA
jgi:predicted GH43/DUF377 family glycosyl hydrolase